MAYKHAFGISTGQHKAARRGWFTALFIHDLVSLPTGQKNRITAKTEGNSSVLAKGYAHATTVIGKQEISNMMSSVHVSVNQVMLG